jgi:ADP-ribosylglycohydrolase
MDRLQRAYHCLEGLSVGDALGGFFEFSRGTISRRITERIIPQGTWHWTDDTQMALSLVAVLGLTGGIDQDTLATSLATHYERARGYGMASRAVLKGIRADGDWRTHAARAFQGQGSYGNGCASRVPPVGAYFADDLDAVVDHAQRSAAVTHAHPEASAGAIAVAVATAWAWRLRNDIPPSRTAFLDLVLPFVPTSTVREKLAQARDVPADTTLEEAVTLLGNGSQTTVQDTVPLALWCAGEQLGSYEEAIWLTLAAQGDCDTTCAIVGGIVVMSTGLEALPATWRAAREPLPVWVGDEGSVV